MEKIGWGKRSLELLYAPACPPFDGLLLGSISKRSCWRLRADTGLPLTFSKIATTDNYVYLLYSLSERNVKGARGFCVAISDHVVVCVIRHTSLLSHASGPSTAPFKHLSNIRIC